MAVSRDTEGVDEFVKNVLSIIEEKLGRKVNLDDRIEEIEEWDSLKNLQIIMAVEERLGVKIPFEKIRVAATVEEFVQNFLKKE